MIKNQYQMQIKIQDGPKTLKRWVACACCKKRMDWPTINKAKTFAEAKGLKWHWIKLVSAPHGRPTQGPVVLIDGRM